MKKFVLFFLILISLNAFAQNAQNSNRNPEIFSLISSPSTVFSGQSVAFTLIASDPDGDKLSFSWDFGNSAVSSLNNPRQSFFLDPGKNSQRFLVKVIVSDGKEGRAEKETLITIREPFFLIDLIEPREFQEFEKAKEIPVKVKITDRELNEILVYDVQVVQAQIGEKGKKINLTADENGFFSGMLSTAASIPGEESLIVNASANVGGELKFTNTSKLLKFLPATLVPQIKTVPEQLFEGIKLDTIRIVLFYPDFTEVKGAKITGNFNGTELNFTEKRDFYESQILNYELKESEKAVFNLLEASDEFGNVLKKFSKEFEITGFDFSFSAEIINLPGTYYAAPGQRITVVSDVLSDIELKPNEVSIDLIEGEKILARLQFDEVSKKWTASYILPSNSEGRKIFELKARTERGKKILRSTDTLEVIISKNYIMDLIRAEENSVFVRLLYPDGINLVEKEEFEGTVSYKGKNFPAVFKKRDDFFAGNIDATMDLGKQKLKVSAGKEFNNASIEKEIEVEKNLLNLIALIFSILIAAIVFGGAIYLSYRHYTREKEPLSLLVTKREEIEKKIKDLQYKYYTGEIKKEEYKDNWFALRKEAELLDSKIKLKRVEKGEQIERMKEFTPLKGIMNKDEIEKQKEEELRKMYEIEGKEGKEKKEEEIRRQREEEKETEKVSLQEAVAEKLKGLIKKPKIQETKEAPEEEKSFSEILDKALDPQVINAEYDHLSSKEKEEVDILINILSAYKKKYSIKQVEEAAIAEGTNPKIARIAARKLFLDK